MSSECFADGDQITPRADRVMRRTSWRKLRANLTPSSYRYIQEFQQCRSATRRHPVMLSPRRPATVSDSSEVSHSSSPSTLFSEIEQFQPMLDLLSPPSYFVPPLLIIEEHRSNLSLSQAIEELCFLIRALLQRHLTEENVDLLQIEMIRRLTMLLTYLAVLEVKPRETMERVTSIDAGDLPVEKHLRCTVETQTEGGHDALSELFSTSAKTIPVNRRLPARRSLSESWIDRLRHPSSSSHRLVSRSETMLGSFHSEQRRRDKPERFPCFIELESSNTCLEASSEFLPDFLVHLQHDPNPTEQFHATETVSSASIDCSQQPSSTDLWQLPMFARRPSSSDELYQQRRATIHFPRQCYSSDRLALVGKRVRVRTAWGNEADKSLGKVKLIIGQSGKKRWCPIRNCCNPGRQYSCSIFGRRSSVVVH